MKNSELEFKNISAIYHQPILNLIYKAASIHRSYHDPNSILVCSLYSIKTGGCTEDCSYCAQSSHYKTGIKAQKNMSVEEIMHHALKAKENGSTRFCLGASWKEVSSNREFSHLLEVIRALKKLDIQLCCTLGMLSYEQALALKEAGLDAYNHNIDTSEEYYSEIITTHSYADRLKTIDNLSKANINLCCGGIVGMGETSDDRIKMIQTLVNLPKSPESVPINILVPMQGTPLEHVTPIDFWELVRTISTTRKLLPYAYIRLAAGRNTLTEEQQAICFLCGANSIFAGEKLLTAENTKQAADDRLFEILGLTAMEIS